MHKIHEIEDLKSLRKELLEKEINIELYSVYNIELIGNVIAKLLSYIENVEYHIIEKENKIFITSDYKKHPIYYLKNENMLAKPKHIILKESQIFLPPTDYIINDIKIYHNSIYVQGFIDYLFEARINNNIELMDPNSLDIILNNYLKLHYNLQSPKKILRLYE